MESGGIIFRIFHSCVPRTDRRINSGPVLRNIVHNYAITHDYFISARKSWKTGCIFILRSRQNDYAYRILDSTQPEEREYRPPEMITWNNHPHYQ